MILKNSDVYYSVPGKRIGIFWGKDGEVSDDYEADGTEFLKVEMIVDMRAMQWINKW